VNSLTIGQLAKRANVNIDTVRYYERNGLLPEPARRSSGYRQYEAGDFARLQFIRRAKDLGFSLKDISELTSLTADRDSDMQGVKAKAIDRMAQVEQKIRELQRVKRGLKKLIDACPGHGELKTCPIVAALNDRTPAE
jgi:MerR family copper efflux transcriptional regulator